jgi:RNA polymerase sigma-70 factor (ECF subfamily)
MTTLEDILRIYGSALARVAASYEADRALREDLLQEMLIAIHTALPALRDADRLAPFVFRIAHNRGVTHVVRERRARRMPSFEEQAAHAATPEDEVLIDEETRRLQDAVRRLPLPYRQVITLTLEGLSHSEIADTLGLGVSNVAVRVNRAKSKLKEILNE